MNTSLRTLKDLIYMLGDDKVKHDYKHELCRRLLVLNYTRKFCRGKKIVDLGAQPFILSCMLALEGYDVTAVDIDPEPYMKIAEACNVSVIKSDLEKGINLPDSMFDCAVFSEVIEHLNPYYLGTTFSEIHRILKPGGILILTTPNIARMSNRLKLIFGKNPIPPYHVKEYTMDEVSSFLINGGFDIILKLYSDIRYRHLELNENNVECIMSNSGVHVLIRALFNLIRRPSLDKLIKSMAYPIIYLVPSLRPLIVVIAQKTSRKPAYRIERW